MDILVALLWRGIVPQYAVIYLGTVRYLFILSNAAASCPPRYGPIAVI